MTILEEDHSLTNFWVIGINYRKADTSLRGKYAISKDQYNAILQTSSVYGIDGLMVLSTCNRTEIYGMCEDAQSLIQLLCSQTEGEIADFEAQCYQKNAHQAILHLYNVAAGLDSQILGDYEIIAQIKESYKIADQAGKINPFFNRLYQSVLQSSRDIRSKTNLSSGTVSVAFAAVQYAKNKSEDISKEQILIIGSGKMGLAATKNLLKLSPADQITIINRTEEKAQQISDQLGIHYLPISALDTAICKATVIIVATNAPQPILKLDHFNTSDQKILIDLSIPNNIDPMVAQYHGLQLVNVDELSKMNDETLKMRMAEVPKAQSIINFNIHQFAEWYIMQKNVPYLKVMKEKLNELNANLRLNCPFDDNHQQKVHTTIKHMAEKMKSDNTAPGCTYIETLSQYISVANNA